MLAKVHLLLRQTDKAESYVNEVLKSSPKSLEGHFTKGDIHMLKGDGANAVAEFRTVIGERPQFIPGYLRLASAHVLNREPELAVDTLQNALKVDPKSKEALLALSRVYALRKNQAAAEEQLRRLVEVDPNDVLARAELGDFLVAANKLPEAEKAYRAIVQRAAANPLGYLKLSRLYRMQGKEKEALKELEDGYRQNQTSAPLLTELIQTYVRQKKHAAATAVCKKRLDDNPQDVFAQNLLGLVFTDMKSYPEAEAALKKAIEMQPLWPVPHTNLANLYLAQGRKKEADRQARTPPSQPTPRTRPPTCRWRCSTNATATTGERHQGLRAGPRGEPRVLVRRQQPGLPARRELRRGRKTSPRAKSLAEGALKAAAERSGHAGHPGLGPLPAWAS